MGAFNDTRLDRTVALKFLPPELTLDPDAKERFIHEAQAASALEHPNICNIHDIAETDAGSEGEGQLFIVMACYEGETLKQKIERGPLKLDDAIDIGVQIALGLSQAHKYGIVHRDIKPANIIVTADGTVKIVDFGLAKLTGMTKLTKTGSTLGTIAYMCPEQLRGDEADLRGDIFSFGVLFYEMLTGHLPFRGDHEAALMYAITNEPPTPLQSYIPDVGSELVHTINRALEKDPQDRYQGMTDVLIDLRRLRKETTRVSGIPGSAAQTSLGHRGRLTKGWYQRMPLIAGAMATVILASLLVVWISQPSVKLNPNMTIRVLDIPFTEIQYPGLSPDGKWLAFPAADANGKWDIYNMHLSGGEPKRITADSAAYATAFGTASVSPDGSLIAYTLLNQKTGRGEVCVVSALGGSSRVVAPIGFGPQWRADGQRITYLRRLSSGPISSISGWKEVWSVKHDGTDQKLEFVDSLGRRDGTVSCSWSPDGTSIAWLRTLEDYSQEIILHHLSTGEERQLTHDGKRIDEVRWLSNDRIVYSSNRSGSSTLWVMPAAGGEPVQITKEGPDLQATFSADNKRLVLYRRRILGDIWRASLDGSDPKQVTFDGRRSGPASLSPDRKWIAYTGGVDEYGRPTGIYLIDRDGNDKQELVPPSGYCYTPSWSPDGRWIAYTARTASAPLDSDRVILLDAANRWEPRVLAIGRPWLWIDPNTLIVRRGLQTWKVDILTKGEQPILADSSLAFPVAGRQEIVFSDLRQQTTGWWVVQSTDNSNPPARPRLLLPTSSLHSVGPAADRSMLVQWDDHGSLWTISLPSGRKKQMPGIFPGLNRNGELRVSYDGKEVVYVQYCIDAKLVMIDDVFE